jgi:hypothetical protein
MIFLSQHWWMEAPTQSPFQTATQDYVDQNQPNNKDLVPGKLITGKTSGAEGEIVSVTAGASVDTVQMFLREPSRIPLLVKKWTLATK